MNIRWLSFEIVSVHWILVMLTVGTEFLSSTCIAQEDTSFNHVRNYIEHEVNSGRCASIVVGIISEKGERVFSYGEIEKGSGKRPDANTLYGIGSITKLFTCSLLAEMAESGKLSLSDPISKFLPDSVRTPTFNGREITLYDLATHTSGLPARPDNLVPPNVDQPYANYSTEQLHAYLSHFELSREIGTRYEYSNIGVGLLGYILAREAGVDYETLVRKRICEPLGLRNTFITIPAGFQSNIAAPYTKEGHPVVDWTFSPVFSAAGALKSTVHDQLVFLAANIGFIHSKLSSTFELTHLKHARNNIALGWHIWNEYGTTNLGHSGSTIGYKSFVGFNKEKRIGVVVLSNSTDAVIDIGLHVLDTRYTLRDQ
ncbi:MAG: serine hydrolase [Ignavibacteriales bacterium]|nr:serine hydrolase [Ignavibacteriales bacterium]